MFGDDAFPDGDETANVRSEKSDVQYYYKMVSL